MKVPWSNGCCCKTQHFVESDGYDSWDYIKAAGAVKNNDEWWTTITFMMIVLMIVLVVAVIDAIAMSNEQGMMLIYRGSIW